MKSNSIYEVMSMTKDASYYRRKLEKCSKEWANTLLKIKGLVEILPNDPSKTDELFSLADQLKEFQDAGSNYYDQYMICKMLSAGKKKG